MNRWKYVLVGLLVGAFAFPLVWNSDPSVIGQTVTVDTTQSPLVVNAAADLADLTPTDGQSVIIKTGTEKGLWYYDKDSATATSVSVLNGPGSVGRFLVINNDAGSVAAATAITAAEITDDGLFELQAFDGSSAKSLTLEELKKTGVQVYNVMQYGAIGDGTTLDTAAIIAAITALDAAGGGVLYFPDAKTYLIDAYLPFVDMSKFTIDLGQSTIKMKDAEPVNAVHGILYFQGCSNFVVRDGKLDGNVDGGAGRTPDQVPAHNLGLYDCDQFVIDNVSAINSPVDGFYVAAVDNQDPDTFTRQGVFRNCIGDGNSRQGMSIINAYDIQIFGGAYINTAGLAPAAGIDIERDLMVETPAAFTFTADTDDVFTAVGHGLSNGQPMQLTTTGTLPAGSALATVYFVRDAAADTFKLAATYSGAALNITDTGAGTHTATPQVYGFAGLQPSVRGIEMYGVRFEGNEGGGLHIIDDADHVVVNGCYFADNASAVLCAGNLVMDGCRIERQATSENTGVVSLSAAGGNLLGRSSSITNTTFLGPIDTIAINIHGSFSDDPIVISNNRFIYCAKPLSTNETVLFTGNFSKGGVATCVNLNNTGAAGSVISGNRFESSTGSQFLSIAASDVTVSSNIFEECGDSYTIRMWGTLTNQVVSNNIFRKAASTGVIAQLETGSDVTFADNKVTGYAATYIGFNGGYIAGGSLIGAGTPEAAYSAGIGTLFRRTDGTTATTLYVKESGTGNTGWVSVKASLNAVEANTAVAASPNVLASSESKNILTNEGTTAANYHTLPTAVAGLTYTFVVQDADGLRITAASGDTIRLGPNVTATAGYIESTTIGDVVTVTAINTTEWVGHAYGTWTNGTWTYALADTP